VADKDTHPRIQAVHVLLRRVDPLARARPAGLAEQGHDLRRGPAGLHHRLRDVLRRGKGPADKDARPVRRRRGKRLRPGKTVLVQIDPRSIGQFAGALGHLHAHREHDHIEAFRDQVSSGVQEGQQQVVGGRILLERGNAATPETDAVAVAGPAEVLAVTLAEVAHVHHEDVGVQVRAMLLGNDGLLDRVHAADRGAVGVLLVAGADALQPGDPLGLTAIGAALDVPVGGAGSREKPLELERGDHVGITPQPVLFVGGGVGDLVTGRQDECADLQGLLALDLIVVDGIGLAGVDAGEALRTEATLEATRGLLHGQFGRIARLHLDELAAGLVPVHALSQRHLRHGHTAVPMDLTPRLALGQFLLAQVDDGEFGPGRANQILTLEVAVDRFGSAVPRGHGLDDVGGASDGVACGKDARPAGGQGAQVGVDGPPAGHTDAAVRRDEGEAGGLADRPDNDVGGNDVLAARDNVHVGPATG